MLNEGIVINGSYTDDGLPVGGPVSVQWGLISGPQQPDVVDNEVLSLEVLFPVEGTYELILIVNDGELDGYDLVTVDVGPERNKAPVVNAGPDQGITLPNDSVTLVGAFTDDGLAPGGPVTTLWTQVDGPAPATIDALPAIADAIGHRADVLLDGGIRRGTDIIKALALGARATLIGRPVLWGLAAGGAAGVARVLELLCQEIDRGMALSGCPSIPDISADLLRPM